MAVTLQALLDLKAQVSGTAAVQSMSNAIGGVQRAAGQATGAFRTLTSGMGGLGGAMGALLPVLSGAGLAALAKGSIDAADNLNDLSQRTGVGVESLSKFGAAADDAGSSVEEVAKSMGKLSKGIVDPASKANAALKSIGISSTDASGKVRSMDAIMLDVADKFAKMPDGATKTALAMELFGKSGMNLIPMLNGGSEALKKYNATITGEGAAAADQFNDSLNAVGRALSGPFNKSVTALLPLLTKFANGIAKAIEGFTKLPKEAQAGIVIVGGLVAGFITLLPAIAAVVGIVSSLGLTFGGIGTVILAIFTGPVGWVALLIGAGVALYAFRDKIGGFLTWLFDTWLSTITAVGKFFYDLLIKPNIDAAMVMWQALQDGWTAFSDWVGDAFSAMGNLFGDYVADPIVNAWNSIVAACKAPLNALLAWAGKVINGYIDMVNGLIRKTNSISTRIKLPAIPLIGRVTVPQFAEGAFVTGPTFAQIGEGRDAEYVLPAGKVAGFISNYQAGARGASAIPTSSGGGGSRGSVGAPVLNLTTGPVMQQGGETWVTMGDVQRVARQTAEQLLATLSTPAGRRMVGVRHG